MTTPGTLSNCLTKDTEPLPAQSSRSTTRLHTAIIFVAVLLPALTALFVLCRWTLTVPYQDDFDAILLYAVNAHRMANVPAELLHVIAAQHNDYKLVLLHLLIDANLLVEHHLNFGFITTVGNLPLFLAGLVLWFYYRSPDKPLRSNLLHFLPMSLLFFSLRYWEGLDWAASGMQVATVLLFGLLAIRLLVPDGGHQTSRPMFLLACVSTLLATGSSSNAFLLGPIGALYLLRQRSYARLLIWCAAFVLPIAAYLYHFTRHTDPPGHHALLSRLLMMLGFLGCGALHSRWAAVVLGILMCMVTAHAWRAGFQKVRPAASYVMLWVFGTALLVGWFRGASGFDVASRYSFYSILGLIFCYDYAASYVSSHTPEHRRSFLVASVLITLAFCGVSQVWAYAKFHKRYDMVMTGIAFYQCNPRSNSPMIDPALNAAYPDEQTLELQDMNEAVSSGIYQLPPRMEYAVDCNKKPF